MALKPFCDICKDANGREKEITDPIGLGSFGYLEKQSTMITMPSIKKHRQAGIVEIKKDLCPECVEKCKKALGL